MVKFTFIRDGQVSGTLNVGEGESHQKEVIAYTYNSAAASGSRFTQVDDLNGTNMLSIVAGDRLYIGYINKFWVVHFALSVGKSSAEKYIMKYWNGFLTSTTYMGVLENSTSVGEDILLQTGQKEYVTWDIDINSNWTAIDNQLDTIPNSGSAKYWICLEVPGGGLSQAPTITEIKIKGSSFNIISGSFIPVFWGKCRVQIHEKLDLSLSQAKAGADIAEIDISSTQTQSVLRFNASGEYCTLMWTIPDGIDTSSSLDFYLSYSADSIINTADIELNIKKIVNGVTLLASQSSDYISTTNINVVTGDVFYSKLSLTNGSPMSIQDLASQNMLAIQLKRTDSIIGNFYPFTLIIKYTQWTTGCNV